MYKVCLPIKVIILGLAIIGVICSPLYAEFGYKDVYQYDEKTEKWVLLEPVGEANDTAYMITDYAGTGAEGNSGSWFSVKSTLSIVPAPMHTKEVRAFGIFGEPDSIVHSNGPLTITVKPLTDNIGIGQNDDGEDWFVLPGTRNYAEWQFVYTVTNPSDASVEMKDITVEDNFSAELEVKGSEDAWLASATQGNVLIYRPNEKQFRFLWDGFSLKPGESASLTIDVKLGKNPAGKQHYGDCNKVYKLNSGGVLKFKLNGKQQSYDGDSFEVWVPCTPPSSFCISLSATGTEWYVRKPGDYYTKMLEGEVSASGDATIAVTFSNFDNLRSIGNSQTIPVFYAIKDEEPGTSDWIRPQDLNKDVSLELRVSAHNTSSWGMWQRVILGTQSPGMYANVGVITFTLVNSQPAYVGN
ncbi:MAG: hypothetical protein GX998_11550 [Firmicutes bacterium]|nr:hypothetical protein [Bacillota bacterium]